MTATSRVVALARTRLEPVAINNGDLAAFVPNQARALQATGCLRHTLAPNAQQMGQKFLSDGELIGR